jgi:hypothetical protein
MQLDKRATIYADKELRDELKVLAIKKNTTLEKLVDLALRQYLKGKK